MHFTPQCDFCYAKDYQLSLWGWGLPIGASPLDLTRGLSAPRPPVCGVPKILKLNYGINRCRQSFTQALIQPP